jgi:Tfp pilus assembly protein PilO
MNKMIAALIAGLFISGAAFATEASGPVVASGASAAKATTHKKAHKSKKAKAASAASAASAAQ